MTTKTWNGSNADWYTNNGGDWTPPATPAPATLSSSTAGKLSS